MDFDNAKAVEITNKDNQLFCPNISRWKPRVKGGLICFTTNLNKVQTKFCCNARPVYTTARIGPDSSKNWSGPDNFCKETINFSRGHRRLFFKKIIRSGPIFWRVRTNYCCRVNAPVNAPYDPDKNFPGPIFAVVDSKCVRQSAVILSFFFSGLTSLGQFLITLNQFLCLVSSSLRSDRFRSFQEGNFFRFLAARTLEREYKILQER